MRLLLERQRGQRSHPHQIVSGGRLGEGPPDTPLASIFSASDPQRSSNTRRTLPSSYTVADLPHRRRAAWSGGRSHCRRSGRILCYVWRDVHMSQLSHEVSGVVSLVASQRHTIIFLNAFGDDQWLTARLWPSPPATPCPSPIRAGCSLVTLPQNYSFASLPLPLRANPASGSVWDCPLSLLHRSPRKLTARFRDDPAAVGRCRPWGGTPEAGPGFDQRSIHAEMNESAANAVDICRYLDTSLSREMRAG